MAGIRENAVLLMRLLKEKFNFTEYAEGIDLMGMTQLNASQLNDAVEHLSSMGYIERLDFLGTHPFIFGGVKLNIDGKLYLEELEGNSGLPQHIAKPQFKVHKADDSTGNDAIFVTYIWDGDGH